MGQFQTKREVLLQMVPRLMNDTRRRTLLLFVSPISLLRPSKFGGSPSIDPQIRALAKNTANPNRIHDAQALSTGRSNENFYAFTTAVDRLSTVSRDHYTTTYIATNATLTYFIPLSILLFLLIGLLAVWGIARRLKDF